MTSVLYFAYGSNLLKERLLARCPSTKYQGIAALIDHRRTFDKASKDGSGKCAFESSPGDAVEGVLWLIPEGELEALDRLEGVGVGYERWQVAVQENGDTREALTYRATQTKIGLLPYDWYLALVVAGAQQQRLSPAVVEGLRLAPSQRDTDFQRKQRQEALNTLRAAGFGEMADELG